MAGTNECLNETLVCNVTDSSEEGMRDGKRMETQTSCW